MWNSPGQVTPHPACLPPAHLSAQCTHTLPHTPSQTDTLRYMHTQTDRHAHAHCHVFLLELISLLSNFLKQKLNSIHFCIQFIGKLWESLPFSACPPYDVSTFKTSLDTSLTCAINLKLGEYAIASRSIGDHLQRIGP